MRKDKRIFMFFMLGLFIIALLPRLYLVFCYRNMPTRNTDGYEQLAKNLLDGRGFTIEGRPTSLHEPLYPFFLAANYYLFGYSYTAVRIIQSIMGAAVCVLVFLTAKRVIDLRAAIISSLISCFNPGFIMINQITMAENIFIFLFSIAMLLFIKQNSKYDIKNLILLGFVLGLAALTRSVISFFPLIILFLFSWNAMKQRLGFKEYIFAILTFIVFFILPIVPWTIRNWHAHHRFVPICTKGGLGLYSSYLPKDGKIFGYIADNNITKKSRQFNSEVDQSNFLFKETIKFIKNNPLQVLKLEILKIAYFFSPFDWEIIGDGAYNYMYGFILPFFFIGVVITINKPDGLLPVYGSIIYYFLLSILTYGSPRFRLSIEPYLIIIASAGIVYFISRFSKKIYGILSTGAYLIFNLFLFIQYYQVKLMAKTLLERINLW